MDIKKQSMVAKSPPSDKGSGAESKGGNNSEKNMTLALTGLGTLQVICGILMIVFGILGLVHGAAMANIGGGLWGGAAAMSCGFVALTAGIKRCCYHNDRTSLQLTIYLALCLVCLAVDTLALLLTSTGLLRDSQRPSYTYLQLDDSGTSQVELEDTNWIPVLANLGLLLSTCLHTLATILAVFKVYRLVCPCTQKSKKKGLLYAHESPATSYCSSNGSKQKLVRHWLGQQSPIPPAPPSTILVYPPPPHLIMEGGPVYGVIPPPTAVYAPYMPPHHGPASHTNRRRSPHHSAREEEERIKTLKRNEENMKEKRKKKEKEREITEEELERTYTGLDREIAEEFISIAMQPRDSPSELNRSRLSQEI
ncbi:uncharacterized protein LOC142330038 [Lycorma delicatula]|uniref:uncharacterized protein LOC142330038 n=1 Tax=Lycorma delicatula TaxID=130591 RepID=UPI003F50E26F